MELAIVLYQNLMFECRVCYNLEVNVLIPCESANKSL